MGSYPKRRPKVSPPHPGEILRDIYLHELGISQTEFAKSLVKEYLRKKISIATMQTKLNEVINKKRAISPEFAVLISKVLKTDPRMWLNLQATYDIWHVEEDFAIAADG
ncbi:MAG: HigA family addiction module antidote protein [Oligoflexales bacterium]|nr:HigA family addiction module antidote protein [Oligoflexales bacterium]